MKNALLFFVMKPKSHLRLTNSEKCGIIFTALLPIIASWDRSGRGFEERWVLTALGLITAICAWVAYIRLHHGVEWQRTETRGLWNDPILYCAIVFMGLLITQWLNAGRTLILDDVSGGWIYGPPPHSGWPSAIDRDEASQMICWFFPAWICLLVIRHWRWSEKAVVRVLLVLLVNAGLLSVLGVLQFLSGTKHQFWFHYLPGYFFSSFGYPNHAASFFVLTFCLGCGLSFFFFKKPGHKRFVWICVLSTMLCFFGAILSLSRAGIIMAVLMLLFVAAYVVRHVIRQGTPVQKLNWSVGGAAMIILMLAIIYGMAGQDIGTELKKAWTELSITKIVNPPAKSLTGIRYPLWKAAVEVWKDYPVFGCGGWGFRYLRKLYIPVEQWTVRTGYANVHNDALNYLVEFGVVGFACLSGAVLVLMYPIVKQRRCICGHSLILFSLLGLGCMFLHSIIDLPFRCPANQYYWLIIAALVGVMCDDANRC